MGEMHELLADLLRSVALDAASPVPGLFTLATVIDHMEFKYTRGKGKAGSLTRAQKIAIRNWVLRNCEKKIINGQVYFKPRW